MRWLCAGESHEKWLPTLVGVVVRRGDRVLLARPANWPELLVTGVIDGFEDARARPLKPEGAIELRPDETVQVLSDDGTPILETWQGERGPVVRLMHRDLDLRVDGELRLRARAITLEADDGGVDIEAKRDVTLKGEVVHLN